MEKLSRSGSQLSRQFKALDLAKLVHRPALSEVPRKPIHDINKLTQDTQTNAAELLKPTKASMRSYAIKNLLSDVDCIIHSIPPRTNALILANRSNPSSLLERIPYREAFAKDGSRRAFSDYTKAPDERKLEQKYPWITDLKTEVTNAEADITNMHNQIKGLKSEFQRSNVDSIETERSKLKALKILRNDMISKLNAFEKEVEAKARQEFESHVDKLIQSNPDKFWSSINKVNQGIDNDIKLLLKETGIKKLASDFKKIHLEFLNFEFDVRQKVERIKYAEENNMTLEGYIKAQQAKAREFCEDRDVFIRFTHKGFLSFLKSKQFKTQRETGKSGGGSLDVKGRRKLEWKLHGIDEDQDKLSPVYGYLCEDKLGIDRHVWQYGYIAARLSDKLKNDGLVKFTVFDSYASSKQRGSDSDEYSLQVRPDDPTNPTGDCFPLAWGDSLKLDLKKPIYYQEVQIRRPKSESDQDLIYNAMEEVYFLNHEQWSFQDHPARPYIDKARVLLEETKIPNHLIEDSRATEKWAYGAPIGENEW